MTVSASVLLTDQFICARDLILNKSKKDPPNNPYKSKYEAKELLLTLEQSLIDLKSPNAENTTIENRLAIVYYFLSSVYFDVEEPATGTEYTRKILTLFCDEPIHPDRIICYVGALNLLGFAACKYDRIDESFELLEKAELGYKSYKETFDIAPKEFCSIFGKNLKEEINGLEKAYTTTLFYLAQVYSAKRDRLKSAKFCHTTLKRQLEFKEYDVIDWALNSATLSQYLMEKYAFKEARNHLAAALILLEKYNEECISSNEENEEAQALKESLRHRTADVYRCWAKYGIYLLSASKDRLLHSEGDTVDPAPQPPEDLQGLIFSGFEEEKINEYECSVTSDFILTLEDARPVFVKTQEWLNKAKEYYTLDDHASDHISILQDSSQLYQNLAFFYSDEQSQSKLHKRRLDLLDKAVNSLNPTYYLNICRELWYELGEICLVMADIKRSLGEKTDDPHFIAKSNRFHSQGIKYFEKYLDSFNLKERNGSIEKYPEGHGKNIIIAYMYLGRMYSKLASTDKAELKKTQTTSLWCYKTVLDYCNAYGEMAEEIPEELAICREMVQLIPLKLSKIENYL